MRKTPPCAFLRNLAGAPPMLLAELAALRQQHLNAVAALLRAIDRQGVNVFLTRQCTCA